MATLHHTIEFLERVVDQRFRARNRRYRAAQFDLSAEAFQPLHSVARAPWFSDPAGRGDIHELRGHIAALRLLRANTQRQSSVHFSVPSEQASNVVHAQFGGN